MQFLSISRRRTEAFSDADFKSRMAAEMARAREMYGDGALRQIWLRGDMPGACILWEAESEAQVRELVGSLPLAQAGMLDVSVIPLKPYPGFS